MKNKNLNYLIAKKYVDNFFNLLKQNNEKLSLNFDLKNIKEIYKNIKKYDDAGYLKEIFNEEHKESLISLIKGLKVDFKANYDEAINSLDNLYKDYFEGREILDIEGIKKSLKSTKTLLNSTIFEIFVSDISGLIGFDSNVLNELEVYIMKHKSGEYVEMKHIRESVSTLIENAKFSIENLRQDFELDDETYVEKLHQKLREEVDIISSNEANKTHTIPEWGKGLLFCLPWIIGFGIFTLYPLITTLIFSFSNVELSTNGFVTESAGFTNYMNMFKDTEFITAISDYIVQIIIYVPIITIFSLMIALLLNTKVKGTGFFRTIFFLPVIITSGPVMKILIEQGVTSIPGLAEMINLDEISANLPHFMQSALNILTNEFIMILWFCGIQILVFLTGLQKIDKGVYEAANIDGASRWERFWKVTLPAINPTMVINVVFTIVMQSLFALNPIIVKIEKDMNESGEMKGYGYASAIAFTYFLVMIILLVIFVLIFKRRNKKVKKGRN